MQEIKNIIFDWGDTLMRDYPEKSGPMCSWDTVEAISDIENVLNVLEGKFTLIVAANADESNANQIALALDRVGLRHYFSHFFSSKDIGVKKPHIDFFTHIFDKVQIDPSESLMIGNTYEKDIVGGKNAGMKTVFFNEFSKSGEYPLADFTIINMIDFLNIIQQKL